MNRKKAITLAELIVSIAILLILSSGVVVSFSIAEGKRLEGAARSLVAQLKWARSQALSQDEQYVVEFDTSAEKYTICKDSITRNGSCDSGEEVASGPIEVNLVSFTGNKVIFYPPWGTADADKTGVLQNGTKQKTISVYQDTGYIEVVQ